MLGVPSARALLFLPASASVVLGRLETGVNVASRQFGVAPIGATLAFVEAGSVEWDAAVIGAGPAGALAARELARAGASVLLVDKAAFPREKPCGCCLNPSAVGVLRDVGLGDLARRCGAVETRTILLACAGARATLPIGALALSRRALDSALVRSAVEAGASFLPGTCAFLQSSSSDGAAVLLSPAGTGDRARQPIEATVLARCVVVADGIGGTFLSNHETLGWRIRRGARIGLQASVDGSPQYRTGILAMCIGQCGYAGAVRLEDGSLDVAAAIEPGFVRRLGGPAEAVGAIMRDAGAPAIESLESARWHGTPLLSRSRRRVQHGPIFVIGDAAGYVEPFTGEGMAWALASGAAVAPHVLERLRGRAMTAGRSWARDHARLIGRRQHACRAIAWTLRRPRLVRGIVRLLAIAPTAASPALARVHGGPRRTSLEPAT